MPPPDKKPWFRNFRAPGERSTAAGEHVPVMLAETLEFLNPQAGQTIVDGTLGYAGHSAELLSRVGPTGKLFAFDLDAANLLPAEEKLTAIGHPFELLHGNFAGIQSALAAKEIFQVDGLLADLGMSSMQVDDAERGFSFMRDGPLDMRMDQSRGMTAAEWLNTTPSEELIRTFVELGDSPPEEAEKIVFAIDAARSKSPLTRTMELRDLIRYGAPVRTIRGPGQPPERKQLMLPMTRVFQAVRIVVNRELANLQQLLRSLPTLLKPGGTVVIISFHSGEDRIVKTTFRDGERSGIYSAVAADALRPTEAEKAANPRSRSAKLRWARRGVE